jgi:hypothetical protein
MEVRIYDDSKLIKITLQMNFAKKIHFNIKNSGIRSFLQRFVTLIGLNDVMTADKISLVIRLLTTKRLRLDCQRMRPY